MTEERLAALKRAAGIPSEPQGSPFDMGRVTAGDPLPDLPPEPVPGPNAEDKAASRDDPNGRSPLYFASLRVARDIGDWERARTEEDARQRAAQAAREADAVKAARQG